MKRHRSVLTRLERVRILQDRGTLDVETASVLGIPKVKHLKIRVRKEKAAPAAEEAKGAQVQAPSAEALPKGAAPSKAAPSTKSGAEAPAKKKE